MRPGPEPAPTCTRAGSSTDWLGPSGVVSLKPGPLGGTTLSLDAGPPSTATPGSTAKRLATVRPETVPSLGLRTRTLTPKSAPGTTEPVAGVIDTSRPGQVTPAGGTATAASLWPRRTSRPRRRAP